MPSSGLPIKSAHQVSQAVHAPIGLPSRFCLLGLPIRFALGLSSRYAYKVCPLGLLIRSTHWVCQAVSAVPFRYVHHFSLSFLHITQAKAWPLAALPHPACKDPYSRPASQHIKTHFLSLLLTTILAFTCPCFFEHLPYISSSY